MGVDQGLGVCLLRTCSIQNGRLAVHSRTEFRSISSGMERGDGVQFALLQKLILHSSLSAAVSVAFHFFLFPPCFALSSSFAAVSI